MNIYWKKALAYSLDDNLKISELKKTTAKKLDEYDYNKIWKYVNENGIGFQIQESNDFHYRFQKIKTKPYIVYTLWNTDLLNINKIIWIVGPRNISTYAKKVLEDLIDQLSSYSWVATVSWLAPWVDSTVHELSIKKNIPTISVLGGWLSHFLNSKERNKIYKIVDNWWLILSEFKLKMSPTYYTFPQRNRIIAGISDFLFLPEAWQKSGSLITVDFANNFDIKVFWVPNDIYSSNSKGINKYIQDWKINCVSDIKEFLTSTLWKKDKQKDSKNKYTDITEDEKNIIQAINEWFRSSKEISIKTWIPQSALLSNLSMMEIKWIIFESNPDTWSIC